MYTVYLLIAPDGRLYVGGTKTSLKSRWWRFLSKARQGCRVVDISKFMKVDYQVIKRVRSGQTYSCYLGGAYSE